MMMYKWNFKQAIKDFFVPKNPWAKFGMLLLIAGLCGVFYLILQ